MKRFRRIILSIAIALFVLSLSACYHSMITYYQDKQNYSDYSGEIIFINYSSDGSIYLAFDHITPKTSDINFVIVGKNVEIVSEYNLNELLVIGKTVQFVTAPRYFGDGYVMPIVGLTVDGTVILDSQTGIENWNDWLASTTRGRLFY